MERSIIGGVTISKAKTGILIGRGLDSDKTRRR
jgi:hypothetical protein